MKLCIPIDDNLGLRSTICLHFAGAPRLLIVHTETLEFEVYEIPADARHDPTKLTSLLSQKKVEKVVVGGIGVFALDDLTSAGIAVISCTEDTVSEIIRAFKDGTVNPVTLGASCGRGRSLGGGRGFSLPTCGGKFGSGRGGCGGC